MVTTNKIAQQFSIRLGNILFRNFFPLYNILYPRFKNRQDAEEIEFLSKTIKPGDTILDIGANIGFYSKILAGLTGPAGKVYCFEPDSVNFSHLLHNTKAIGNTKAISTSKTHGTIIPINKAVAETTKTLKLYTSKLLNVDHRTYKVDNFENEISIPATSIDDFVSSSGNVKVDFIKMDIQGFELSALKGMVNTLRANPEIKLLTELWPYGLRKAGTSCAEFIQFIQAQQFQVFEMKGETPIPFSIQRTTEIENAEFEFGINIFIRGGKNQ